MGTIIAVLFGALILGLFQKYQDMMKGKIKKEKEKSKKKEKQAIAENAVLQAQVAELARLVKEMQDRQPK
jgi:type VI protein secretion system component VasK